MYVDHSLLQHKTLVSYRDLDCPMGIGLGSLVTILGLCTCSISLHDCPQCKTYGTRFECVVVDKSLLLHQQWQIHQFQ